MPTTRLPGFRARAACGVIGPAVFTAAWLTSTLRQDGYSVAAEHISGLAAPDALAPHVMTTGFLTMGACTAAFASALQEALGGPDEAGSGPRLLWAAGLATFAAGMLRRDHMLLDPPGARPNRRSNRLPAVLDSGQSWRNNGHDLASAVAYSAIIAGPMAMARRFRRDPAWARLHRPALAVSAATAGLLGVFVSRVIEPYNGIVQRAAVTLPGSAMMAVGAGLVSGRYPGQRGRRRGARGARRR